MEIKLLVVVKLIILISVVQNKMILKQVIILNRHSLRAPLSSNLKEVSPKPWPKWNVKAGILTTKGAKLAGYMGSYLAAWLKKEGILPACCPNEDDLHVFSNTKERTLTSAQSFIENGFPNCTIAIRHTGINIPNPLFNPIIHNTSATFKEDALNEIQEALDSFRLNEAYELVSQILDYKQSRACESDKQCSLVKWKNSISIIPGFRPTLSGPLKLCNQVVDAFLMQNYEGFPTEDVAWGHLTDSNSWQTIIELNRAYFNATYKTSVVAKDLSRPLIECITEIFLKEDNTPKVTILFGHDINIYTVFKTLLVKPYAVANQIEVIPIGSAVVFQKWYDDENQEDYFKLSLVYQSTGQLRDGNVLSLLEPPQIITLEIENCEIDDDGFCPWNSFEMFLIKL